MKTLKLALVGVTLIMAACTDADGARRALESQGYKDITITGYRAWGCGEHDQYHTGFTALGQNGITVTGVVCRGGGFFGKGSTVRID